MDKTGYYIYSVIAADEERTFDAVPIGYNTGKAQTINRSHLVYTICHNGLAAVVSNSEIREYPITRENMLAHQRVNEIAMKKYVVLPVKFCTIAESRDLILERLLEAKHDELLRKLEYLNNKNEFGLKVLWREMEQVFAAILDENSEIKKMKERGERLNPRGRRNIMIETGEMVKNALLAKKEMVGGILFDRLARLSNESKKNEVYGDRMLLNAVFLIERSQEKSFDDEINNLSCEHSKTMDWKYVGPAPAANFVEIVVKWGD